MQASPMVYLVGKSASRTPLPVLFPYIYGVFNYRRSNISCFIGLNKCTTIRKRYATICISLIRFLFHGRPLGSTSAR